ncbi:MAG: biotin/lipoyl-binding protein, partial [Patescibacteria group bacterium]|nr:biotin/lipoyl-binding protein [Patescibacteria group bacterium]
MNSTFRKIKLLIVAHKILTVIAVIIVIGGIYYVTKARTAGTVTPTYTLSTVSTGTVMTTVTGTGQVSANNQIDVAAQVAGTIDAINVKVGDSVGVGQTLAHINSPSAIQGLSSAQLSYAQLVEPAKATDIQNDENAITKAYSNAWSDISSVFVNLPTVKNGLNTDFYNLSGYLSDVGPNNNFIHSNPTASNGYIQATKDYDSALKLFNTANSDFQAATANSTLVPATSTVKNLLKETLDATTAFAQTVADANTLLDFIQNQNNSSSNQSQSTAASTAASNLQSWSSTVNSEVSSLSSDQNAIIS